MMKKYLPIIISLILIFSCSDPGASDLEQAKLYMSGDSLNAPDTALAISNFKLAAEAGNGEAMFYLAYYCQYGFGMEKDGEKALGWYESSAEAGYPRAQNKLGMVYYSGNGKEKITSSQGNGSQKAQSRVMTRHNICWARSIALAVALNPIPPWLSSG